MVALRRPTSAPPKNPRVTPQNPEDKARQRLRTALASVGITLSAENDSDLVSEASAALVGHLVAEAEADRTSDDVIFAAGFFTQAAVAHFAKSLRTGSDAPLIALANFTESLEEFARVHPAILEGFRALSAKRPKLAGEIGESLTAWLLSPGKEGFAALVQLFRRTLLVCRSSRVSVRAMV
jgi:hypothetical protein